MGKLENRLAGNDAGKTPGGTKRRKRGKAAEAAITGASTPVVAGVIAAKLEDSSDGDYITPEQMSSL